MKKLPLQAYIEALGSQLTGFQGDAETSIAMASSDSREIAADGLFVAIAGARLDGAAFVDQAIRAGAVAIVADRPLALPPNIALLETRDAYQAAGMVAEVFYDYPIHQMKTVGITGTNGKTTCAFLMRDILRQTGGKTGMIGTVQYEIGQRTLAADRTTPTPFELQKILREMADAEVEWLVMEVSSHALAQGRLGQACLQGALFTNLTGDHGDYHITMENYFQAKQRLFFDHLAADAPAVVNQDDPWGERLLREMSSRGMAQSRSFAATPDSAAAYQINDIRTSRSGSQFCLTTPANPKLDISIPLIGRFNIMNAAGVAALADQLQIPHAVIRQALATCPGIPGRLQSVPSPTELGFGVVVDYAHTDDALQNVLLTLRQLKPARLAVVFGCGGDRDRSKRARMGRIAGELADLVYITSDNPRSEEPAAIIREIKGGLPPHANYQVIADRSRAIAQAIAEAEPDSLVLIAGKGHENYQIIGDRQQDFDDSQVARLAMQRRAAAMLGVTTADLDQSEPNLE